MIAWVLLIMWASPPGRPMPNALAPMASAQECFKQRDAAALRPEVARVACVPYPADEPLPCDGVKAVCVRLPEKP